MRPSLSFVPDVDEDLAAAVEAGLSRIEESLRETVATDDWLARQTARHLMDAGGKRVRPLLVLLAASFGDPRRADVIDAGVLVELTHLATLYHDDVMDDAGTRRGAVTAHQLWGNSAAILTGDFLFARASALSSRLGPEAVLIHARTFERLCMGQLHETVGPREGEDPFEHYLAVLADKTASLIATAGRLGALMGGCDDRTADVLARYGEKVGVAFQLADDVLDLNAEAAATGKTPGTDLREGIATMPTLLLRRRASEGDDSEQTQNLVRVLDSDLSSDEALAHAVALLREDPAVQRTQEMARALAREGIEILHELPEAPGRDALEAFTLSLVERSA